MSSILRATVRHGSSAFLICAAAAGAVAATGWVLPDGQLGRQTAPLLLLSRPEIRADLKLPADVELQVDAAVAELRGQALALRGRRDAEAVAARRAIDEAQRVWIESHLTDAQRSRLGQLDLQWEGPAALHSRKALAETLRLTDDQRKKLGAAVSDRESKRLAAGRDTRADDAALTESVLTILAPDQKDRWKAMLGPACRFQIAARSEQGTAAR